MEDEALAEAIRKQLDGWRADGDWQKVKCMELLFVVGRGNKDVSETLQITEQQVANFKFDFLARMRALIQKQGIPEEVFPELYQD